MYVLKERRQYRMHWKKTFCNSALTGCDTMVLFFTCSFHMKTTFLHHLQRNQANPATMTQSYPTAIATRFLFQES